MSRFKNILIQVSFVWMIGFSSIAAHAQDIDKALVQNIIEKKEFVFKAQSVTPMSGMTRQLTSEYDVRFLGDSVISYLPYFGRAYSAGYGEGGGIDFTSTNFEYKVNERKKGGWDVSIKPKDVRDVQTMNFSISENGYAMLQVNSNNRQPISFYGYIVERKRK